MAYVVVKGRVLPNLRVKQETLQKGVFLLDPVVLSHVSSQQLFCYLGRQAGGEGSPSTGPPTALGWGQNPLLIQSETLLLPPAGKASQPLGLVLQKKCV